MRYFMTYTPADPNAGAGPSPECEAKMGEYVAKMYQAGVLLQTGGLLPVSMGGARVRVSDGRFTVTDGPYSEAKEVIAGYAIVQAASREEAIQHAKNFLEVAGDGETEIRQMMDEPPPAE